MNLRAIHNGRDNRLVVVVNANGQAANLSGVTRATLSEAGTVLVDSLTAGAGVGQAIDWTQGRGVLVFYLGHEGLAPGPHKLELTLYDDSTPNGLVVGTFVIAVIAGPADTTRYPATDLTPPISSGTPLDTAAEYSVRLGQLRAPYQLTSDGVITDGTGEPITDETGDAITDGT